MPSFVTIREYDASDMGNQDAQPLSEETYEGFVSVPLKQGRIYEVVAKWEKGDFKEYDFYGEAYYSFATENVNYKVWTKEEIESLEPKNPQTVTLLAHIKEKLDAEKNYVVISSDTDEFPGAFVMVVDPDVYGYGNINGGDWFQITMEMTDEMYGELPICNAIEMLPGNTFIIHEK